MPTRTPNPGRRAKPPASGNLPAHGKRILAAAYESAKARQLEQGWSEKSAKRAASAQAWCAVKRHYYKRGSKWVKRKEPLGRDEHPPGCTPLARKGRRKNPTKISPDERDVLEMLIEKAEASGDDWGTITAVDGYLEDDEEDRTPIEYLNAVYDDVMWHYGHVGDDDDPTMDKASAKRAQKQIANAIRELEGLRSGGAGYQQALAAINRDRARRGERPLDPKAAGWTSDDVLAEAKRIGATNPRKRDIADDLYDELGLPKSASIEQMLAAVLRDRSPADGAYQRAAGIQWGLATGRFSSAAEKEIRRVGPRVVFKWILSAPKQETMSSGLRSVQHILGQYPERSSMNPEPDDEDEDEGDHEPSAEELSRRYYMPEYEIYGEPNPKEIWVVVAPKKHQWPVAPLQVVTRDQAIAMTSARGPGVQTYIALRTGFPTEHAARSYADKVEHATIEVSRPGDGTVVYRGSLLGFSEDPATRDLKFVDRGRLVQLADTHVETQLGQGKKALVARRERSGSNPYLGDAVELAQRRKYEEERSRWEKSGRRGPPPTPPRSRQRNPPKRKRRPGPHIVELEFDTPKGFRDFKILASGYFERGPEASQELGRPDPQGWWLPSSPGESIGFLYTLGVYGGRVVSSRPAPSGNPQKNPSRAASMSRRITGV